MGEPAKVIDLKEWSLKADAWMNLSTGLGVRGRDKSRSDFFARPREFVQIELEDLYRGDALAARIVDVPANDMVRAWWELNLSTELEGEGEEGEEITPEEANKISAYVQKRMQKLQAKRKVKKALRWDNLYGGSLLVVIADDGKALEEPLDLNAMKSIEAMHVLHRFQVAEGPLETDPRGKDGVEFGEPIFYNISQGTIRSVDFNVVHASRVLRFQNVDLPEDTRRRQFDRFGDSVFVRCWEALSDFQMAYRAVAALIQDFAQGVWHVPHLREMALAKKEEVIQRRIAVQDFVKGVTNAIMVDSELGEKYERLATPVQGLAELLDRLGIRLSAATGMPITLLLGIAPKGWASEDASGEANWDDAVSARQEDNLDHQLVKLVTMVFHESASPTKKKEPESWAISFNPLTQPTPMEKAQLEKTVAEKDAINIDKKIVKPSEVRASRYTSDGFSTETNLDPEISEAMAEADKKKTEEPPQNGPPTPPAPFGVAGAPNPPKPEEQGEQGPPGPGAPPDDEPDEDEPDEEEAETEED